MSACAGAAVSHRAILGRPDEASEFAERARGEDHLTGLPGFLALLQLVTRGHYISTSRPTSTTWAAGTPKYAAGRLALRCIAANKDFLQTAMPDTLLLGITITRLK